MIVLRLMRPPPDSRLVFAYLEFWWMICIEEGGWYHSPCWYSAALWESKWWYYSGIDQIIMHTWCSMLTSFLQLTPFDWSLVPSSLSLTCAWWMWMPRVHSGNQVGPSLPPTLKGSLEQNICSVCFATFIHCLHQLSWIKFWQNSFDFWKTLLRVDQIQKHAPVLELAKDQVPTQSVTTESTAVSLLENPSMMSWIASWYKKNQEYK